jgi:hypothetical protein
MNFFSLIKQIVIGISVLSLVTGTLISIGETKSTTASTFNEETYTIESPPEWAMGSFNGTFGILKHGIPSLELGRVEGYWESNANGYNHFEKGRIQGEFFINESLIPNWNISAKMLSRSHSSYTTSIFYGRLFKIQDEKTSFFVGIGKLSYDGTIEFKLFTILNDNYYFNGNWSEFKE